MTDELAAVQRRVAEWLSVPCETCGGNGIVAHVPGMGSEGYDRCPDCHDNGVLWLLRRGCTWCSGRGWHKLYTPAGVIDSSSLVRICSYGCEGYGYLPVTSLEDVLVTAARAGLAPSTWYCEGETEISCAHPGVGLWHTRIKGWVGRRDGTTPIDAVFMALDAARAAQG